jgi:hypothetical protein
MSDDQSGVHANIVCVANNLLCAAKNLRAAQRAYMADRGNDEKGRQVAADATALDLVIEVAESELARCGTNSGAESGD